MCHEASCEVRDPPCCSEFAEFDRRTLSSTPRPFRSSFARPPETSLSLCREAATIVRWPDRSPIVLSRQTVPAVPAAVWYIAGVIQTKNQTKGRVYGGSIFPPRPFNLSHFTLCDRLDLRSLGRLESPALLSGLLQ